MRHPVTGGLAALFTLVPLAVSAHVGPGAHGGLAQGFAHPLTGADHVLVMVAVGVFAAALGGRAVWAVPAAFVGFLLVGALLGVGGVPLAMVEPGIALSVIVLGVAVAAGLRLPTGLAMGLVGLFALFHGHAHGSEAAGAAPFLPYAAGFVAATVLLHLAGIGLGRSIDRLGAALAPHARRVIGAAGALAGAVILVG